MKFLLKLRPRALGSGVIGLLAFHTPSDLKRVCFAELAPVHESIPWNYNWDGRQNVKGNGARHMLLIRHGQYDTTDRNDKNRILTALGRTQAERLGKYLREFIGENNLSRVVSSDQTRAIETRDIAMANYGQVIQPTEDPDLREKFPHVTSWHLPGNDNHTPEEIQERTTIIDRAFTTYFTRRTVKENAIEIYFVHSNVIRYLTCKALQLPLNAWARFELRHCSITWFEIKQDGTVVCRAFGDTAHFKDRDRTIKNDRNPPKEEDGEGPERKKPRITTK